MFSISTFNEFDIEIPQHCKYARGNKMSIPIIKQVMDFNEDYKEEFKKLLYSNLSFKKLKLLNKPKKCTCNTIIINNFYSNVDSTRQFMRSTQFIDNYSKNSFINDQIKSRRIK